MLDFKTEEIVVEVDVSKQIQQLDFKEPTEDISEVETFKDDFTETDKSDMSSFIQCSLNALNDK